MRSRTLILKKFGIREPLSFDADGAAMFVQLQRQSVDAVRARGTEEGIERDRVRRERHAEITTTGAARFVDHVANIGPLRQSPVRRTVDAELCGGVERPQRR